MAGGVCGEGEEGIIIGEKNRRIFIKQNKKTKGRRKETKEEEKISPHYGDYEAIYVLTRGVMQQEGGG